MRAHNKTAPERRAAQGSLNKSLWGLLMGLAALTAVTGTAHAMTLRSWDTIINTPGRFRVLNQFNNEAVLDKETGLVWERSPSARVKGSWNSVFDNCYGETVGGRKGWRLPTIEELLTLVDPAQGSPALPSDHPFDHVGSVRYWSGTTFGPAPDKAMLVDLGSGTVVSDDKSTGEGYWWCVRGGHGHDGV